MNVARALVVSVAFAAASVGASAQAGDLIIKDTSVTTRPQQVDVVGIISPFIGYMHFGLGGWYGYPVMPEGFLPTINDSFYIEGGAALERYSESISVCDFTWWRMTPLVGGRWNFHLTNDWTVYGTAKVGYGIGFGESSECGTTTVHSDVSYSTFAFDAGVGAYWNFSESWRMRFDLGYFGAMVGAGTDL